MDFDPPTYSIAFGVTSWLKLVGIIGAVAIGIGVIAAFLRNGASGGKAFGTGFVSFFKDLLAMSPRRVIAMARLTVIEALRRKALLVFVVFAVLLMFGGWFLTDSNDREDLQVSVHITFMLTTISWLILPVVMFLSCWSLPEDIRIRSLHTVVTKPVRRVEVVMGRILGFSTMATAILLLMGIVGYIWIQRQVSPPENPGDPGRLTCRVPAYGNLFFLDSQSLPKNAGINVGDPWMYRSFVEGNSRARAVWIFRDVTPDRMGDQLSLESRFEAFRTVKGAEDTINEGIEAQYTLVRNMREDAFAAFGVGASFRPAAESMREGNFQNAANLLSDAATRMGSSQSDFPPVDCQQVSIACMQVEYVLTELGDDFKEVVDAFVLFGQKAGLVESDNDASYQNLSTACETLAEVLRTRGEDLMESMPRIEVPLESFRVSEFHEGDNVNAYPRKLSYAADYEATARFLAEVTTEWNDQGKLVDGAELSPGLADDLTGSAGISAENADLLVEVLQEQIDAEGLTITDGKLTIADNSRWLQYFMTLVREEKLISRDPAGWVLEADLFDDLASNGMLRIDVACMNEQMFLGMARPDLFIRLKDNSFLQGYSKALLNIGLMLSLVIVLGVTASCVVKGPVSFFFTLTVFVIGQFFHELMLRIVGGAEEGGGLVESAMLIYQHRNPSTGLDASENTQQMVATLDSGVVGVLNVASNIIPDFSIFSDSAAYIENGFDVPWNSSVLPAILTFVGFLIPCIIIGAACLKFRELESK
ncbi:MAG: ABC transporter permease [Fuerstiella sp.]|nr:ABC transporter permease [Fuerstiella sp.]